MTNASPPPDGYYVWGQYTTVAWFATEAEALSCAAQMNCSGGTIYTVRPAPPIHGERP